MYGIPTSSATRRFLGALGFALAQALLFGALVGLLVYFRVPREAAEEEADEAPSWPLRLRLRFEALELWSFDWRARELGRASHRSEAVALVPIDDETVANARKDPRPGLDIQPWPREIVGGVVDRVLSEGAAVVLLDLGFPDASPSLCPIQEISGPGPARTDDDAFRSLLERHPGKAILAFGANSRRGPQATAETRPYLVDLGERASWLDAREGVRRLLGDHRPAFLIPDGSGANADRVRLWAGASSEEDGRALARQWELRGAATARLREFSPSERRYQVSPTELLVSLAEIEIDGLDAAALPHSRGLEHPVPSLLGEKLLYGAVGLPADLDGAVRGLPLVLAYADAEGKSHLLPSAPLSAAMQRAGTRMLRYEPGTLYTGGRLHIGDSYAIPMDERGYTLIRWESPDAADDGRGSIKRIASAWRVVVNLYDKIAGLPPHYRNDLDGRVAVITNTSRYGPPLKETPIGRVSGGAVLAQLTANLLASEGISRADPRLDLLFTAALAFLGAALALATGGFRSAGGAIVYVLGIPLGGAAYVFFTRYLFLERGLWVAMAGPLLAMLAAWAFTSNYVFRAERKVLDALRTVLGRSVSPELARRVSDDLGLLKPERRQMTVYFSDIEGFSRLAEQLPAPRLVELLNEYLSEMTRVVGRTQGQVDKYIGDTVSAFWGAPLRTDRHPHQGCEAALSMRESLLRRRAEWEERYGIKLEFRAGLDTGEVTVGDMGTELKSNYTVIGDAVSLASRLERENRYYGTFILTGEGTARAASDAFLFREVDRVRVKGRAVPIQIFELIGRREKGSEKPEQVKLYEQALLAYHQRRFLEAADLFNRCDATWGDPVAKRYAERCETFLDAPPPREWDGVFESTQG